MPVRASQSTATMSISLFEMRFTNIRKPFYHSSLKLLTDWESWDVNHNNGKIDGLALEEDPINS